MTRKKKAFKIDFSFCWDDPALRVILFFCNRPKNLPAIYSLIYSVFTHPHGLGRLASKWPRMRSKLGGNPHYPEKKTINLHYLRK